MDTLHQKIYDLFEQNRREKDGYRFTVPSPDTYPYQWLWDSCFHAIVLSKFDIDMAKDEIRSLISKQFEDGMIPHMIYWEPGTLHMYEWGTKGTSALTQPPILAHAVWEIYKHGKDTTFLEEVYPRLSSFYHYLISKRDPRDRHLVGIINPDESGEDNSPRFDAVLNVPSDITLDEHLDRRLVLVEQNKACDFDAELCMKHYFWVKDVPFNALLIENLRMLSHIASLLEKPEDEHFAKLHIELITGAMRQYMFSEGFFYSTAGEDYEKLRVETWAHFAPLFADLYTPDEAEYVVKELLNPETFWGDWGVRTVSRKEQSYRADGFWRGSSWQAVHWFIYKGLTRYGYTREAEMVEQKTLNLLERSGFREYYNPETGEGYGAEDFTWGALVLDMDGS